MGVLAAIRRRAGRAAGWFTTPLLPDDLLGTLNPLWSADEPHAKVVGRRRETADTTTLLLRTGQVHPPHRPGQFVGIGTRLRGVWHWRTYSATSRPADPLLAVTVTAVPGGTVSGALAHHTPVGTLLRVGPPAGEFVLPDPVPEKLLFLTAGSGITPVMGMLRELAATTPDALRGAVAAALRPHPRRPGVRPGAARAGRARPGCVWSSGTPRRPAGSPRTRWPTRCPTGRPGRPGPAARPGCSTPWPSTGGAPGDPESLRVERFRPPTPVAADATGGRVRFTTSGIEAEAGPGTPLMVAGESAGARAAQRLPDGHLSHLRGPVALGRGAQPAHRPTPRHPRRSRADLRVRGRGRRRDRALGAHTMTATLNEPVIVETRSGRSSTPRRRRPPRT